MSAKLYNERGTTLVIALVIMGVAVLLIGAFLYYVSTSQRVTTAVKAELTDHYSADAGVEHALWRLTNESGFTQTVASGPQSYTLEINGESVAITVTRVTPAP
ncbi:MAG: hypothetical protein U9Q70_05890 [Chloroflexota bacterium]|nr:hypothetical protein [Chloroflexota bacterium]